MLDVGNALKNPGQPYPFALAFDYEPMEMLGDPVSFTDVAVKGTYFSAGETVNVSGEISALVHSRCARCLSPVTQPLRAELKEVFAKEVPEDEDSDTHPMEGYAVELASLVQEALILEMPMRFLCREDCKGLCPVCGKNRNTDPCTCPEGPGKPNPFQALSGIINDLNDEEV